MKKLFAITMVIVLIFTLCSCKSANNDISNNYSDINPAFNSTTNDESFTDDVTSELENIDASSNVPSDTPSEPVPSTPSNVVSSEPIADGTSKEETSSDEKPQIETRDPSKFVPDTFPIVGYDINKNPFIDEENRQIVYNNIIYYKGVAYAYISGKYSNEEKSCTAIVKVGDKDKYEECVFVLDTANNERPAFNIYNDRIYFFQYERNDIPPWNVYNEIYICSVDLSGKNKRIEKKLDVSFTHLLSSEPVYYQNSKYLFFYKDNYISEEWQITYRYDIETKEMVELDYKLETHNTIYSIGERVFVWDYGECDIYEYDIDFKNEKFFVNVDYQFAHFRLVVSLEDNGFLFYNNAINDKYFVDFSGNRTQLS